MRRLLSFAFSLLASVNLFSAAFTSTTSGNFADGSTWVGGVAPATAGDTWTIAAGHSVIYNADNSSGAGWGASVVTGNLVMTNTAAQSFLKMQGHLSGAGNWRIGAVGNPITFVSTNLPRVVVEFTGSAQCKMSGTNNLGWYGDSSHMLTTYLSNACANAATSIVVSNVPPNVTTNDVIWIGNGNTAGQAAAEYYVVGAISGTTITLKQTPLGAATNHWPGVTFRASTSSIRPIGTAVAFLSQPIVIKESAQRAVSLVTASRNNVISGVLCQNFGNGLVTSCSGWTAYSNTVNNCLNGGLAFDSCAGWTAYSNIANNCGSGGLAIYSCSGWTAYSNIANNCLNGGLANYYCTGWTAYDNTANNCSNGGLAYYYCSDWTAYSNTANSCLNGGLAYSCTGWTAYSNIANSSAPLFKLCSKVATYGNSIGYTSDTHLGYGYGFDLIAFDNNTWLGPWGLAIRTNELGIPLIHHTITTANPSAHVAVWHPLSVRPGGQRTVTVSCYLTNNVAYYAAVIPVPGSVASPSQMTLLSAGAASGGWTNSVFTLVNTNTVPISGRIWVSAVGSSPNTVGYSYVQESSDTVGLVQ